MSFLPKLVRSFNIWNLPTITSFSKSQIVWPFKWEGSVIALAWTNFEYFLKKIKKQKRSSEVDRVLRCVVVMRVGMEVIFSLRIKFLFLIHLKFWVLDLTLAIYREIKITEAECCSGCYRGERRKLASFLGGRQWEKNNQKWTQLVVFY